MAREIRCCECGKDLTMEWMKISRRGDVCLECYPTKPESYWNGQTSEEDE